MNNQSATTLQVAQRSVASSTDSRSVVPSLFGDALAQAKAANERNTATHSSSLSDSHIGKKTGTKPADAREELSAKSSTLSTPAAHSLPARNDVPTLPLRPVAAGDKTSAKEAVASDEVPRASDGSFGQTLSPSAGNSSVGRAVLAIDDAPTQQANSARATTSIDAAGADSGVTAESSPPPPSITGATDVVSAAPDASAISNQGVTTTIQTPSDQVPQEVDGKTLKQPVSPDNTATSTTGLDTMPLAPWNAPVMSNLPTDSHSQAEVAARNVNQKSAAADAKTEAAPLARANRNDVGDQRSLSSHQATTKQPGSVNSQGGDLQNAPATSGSQGSPASSRPADSLNDAQVLSAASPEANNNDAAAALSAASATIPQSPVISDDFDLGLTSGDSTIDGLDLNLSGLSAVTSGASKSVAGGSSSVTKSKSGDSDAAVSTLSGNSSLEKADGPAQVSASANADEANANLVAAQANVHAGMGTNGTSQVDGKATQHRAGDTGAEGAATSQGAGSAQSLDGSATQVVHRAQLIQAMHGSEMRMGMNSAEFGNISISAAVSHQTLTAQISLDHEGLSRALTAQLPDIEKKLGNAYGLPSRVEVRDGSSSPQQGSSRREGEGTFGKASVIPTTLQAGLGSMSVMTESASSTTYSPSAGMRLDILI